MNAPVPSSLAALRDLALEPNWADLDPSRHLYLLVDLSQDAPDPALAAWLAVQPIPTIGVGGASEAVDCVVPAAELGAVVARIEHNPQAAAVLVQVLRNTAALDVNGALILESLAYATLQGGDEFARWLTGNREAHPPRTGESGDAVVVTRSGERLDVTLNRPGTRNCLSVEMRDGLTEAFKLVAVDDSIARVEVKGNGPCFSAGGDLREFGTVADVATAHAIRMLRMPAGYLASAAERYTFALHGACIGAGIELPAFAGRVTATEDTFFQLPEVGFGLIPGAGGCVSISRRIGRQRTAYMALMGERVSATDALAWGLIDAIVDQDSGA